MSLALAAAATAAVTILPVTAAVAAESSTITVDVNCDSANIVDSVELISVPGQTSASEIVSNDECVAVGGVGVHSSESIADETERSLVDVPPSAIHESHIEVSHSAQQALSSNTDGELAKRTEMDGTTSTPTEPLSLSQSPESQSTAQLVAESPPQQPSDAGENKAKKGRRPSVAMHAVTLTRHKSRRMDSFIEHADEVLLVEECATLEREYEGSWSSMGAVLNPMVKASAVAGAADGGEARRGFHGTKESSNPDPAGGAEQNAVVPTAVATAPADAALAQVSATTSESHIRRPSELSASVLALFGGKHGGDKSKPVAPPALPAKYRVTQAQPQSTEIAPSASSSTTTLMTHNQEPLDFENVSNLISHTASRIASTSHPIPPPPPPPPSLTSSHSVASDPSEDSHAFAVDAPFRITAAMSAVSGVNPMAPHQEKLQSDAAAAAAALTKSIHSSSADDRSASTGPKKISANLLGMFGGGKAAAGVGSDQLSPSRRGSGAVGSEELTERGLTQVD